MSTFFGHDPWSTAHPKDVKDICAATLADLPLDGKRVLVLIRITRDTLHRPVLSCVERSAAISRQRAGLHVATGTHAAMERIGSTVTSD